MLCFRCGSYNQDDQIKCQVCGQEFVEERRAKRSPSHPKIPASIFAPGETVGGKYKIVEIIGQGGVGTVYRARDTEIDVDVALKAIAPNLLQTEEERKLFSKMVKQARKLHHPNIIRIYDEGHEGSRRFFTMKLLEGLTLRKIIRLRHDKGQSFTAEEIVPIFHQLAAALDYAHKSTWHGDLKPENIIILPDLLKVTDFNLVKGLPLKPFLGIAKSRSKGFPYIAPELRVEASQIDGRCDVYSLGVILAEMLTGIVFEGHFTRALGAALEQLPTKLDGLVRKSVAEHPDGRFQKAGELAKELEVALEKLSGALPPPAIDEKKRPPRKTPPPPPAETNPGTVPDELDEEEAAQEADGATGDSLEEIGQSQVVLLDGQQEPTTGDETLNQSDVSTSERKHKRREERASDVMKGMRPPPLDEQDDGGAQVDDGKRGRPPLPDDRLVDDHGDDDDMVPPPLPEGEGEDALDASASFDDGLSLRSSGSTEGPVGEGTLNEPPSIADDVSKEETAPELDEEDVGIHEELTALKPQPRTDLRDAAAAAEEPADPEESPDELETVSNRLRPVSQKEREAPGEEPPETVSAEELEEARERSSPRLHAAQPLRPPVVGPAQSTGAFVPPGMRPVKPPEREKSAAGLWLGVIAAIAVVGLLFWALARPGDDGELAQQEPGEPVVAPTPVDPPPNEPPPSEPAPAADDPDPVEEPPPVEESPLPPPDESAEERARKQQQLAALETEEAKARDSAAVEAEQERRRREEEARRRKAEREREAELAELRDAERAAADERRRQEEEERKKRAAEAEARKKAEEEKKLAAASAADTKKTKCPAGMVLIPGGTFKMGSSTSDPMRNFGEKVATSTTVENFCISYFEFPNSRSRKPTTGVSWNDANRACKKKGRRLCTEAEWERACKGPRNRRFAYGNRYDVDKCNTEDGAGKPRSVEGAVAFKKCRSPYNVFAMSGNAEEWVADNFRPGASSRTAKGGAANRPDWASRCAARRGLSAGTRKQTLGFRCCADPE